MSAQDNLSQQLFHGTHVDLNPGETVKPGKDFGYAFATSDPTLAAEYGPKVYQVHPVDPEAAHKFTQDELSKWVGEPSKDNKSVVKSKQGFTVINRHK